MDIQAKDTEEALKTDTGIWETIWTQMSRIGA